MQAASTTRSAACVVHEGGVNEEAVAAIVEARDASRVITRIQVSLVLLELVRECVGIVYLERPERDLVVISLVSRSSILSILP
jgi:hypothetical protein